MAAQSSVFPAFISDTYRPGRGFPDFERAAAASAEGVRRHFTASFDEVQKLAARALSTPRNQFGSLDLNPGEYRQAAQAAEAHAQALREVAVAAERAARSHRDTSEATRLSIQAARAAALEAENGARAANQQAVAIERLQAQLNQSKSATTQVVASSRGLSNELFRGADGARAHRFAFVQLGQQMQDVAIQMQAGVSPLTIFVQQGSQAAFAMSAFRGAVGRVGAFLSGPFGALVFVGVAALGALVQGFRDSKASADSARDATSLFGEAQSSLGALFDLTTGKIKEQTGALAEHIDLIRAEIRLKALQLEQQALDDDEAFRKGRPTRPGFFSSASGAQFQSNVAAARAAEFGGSPVVNQLQQQAFQSTQKDLQAIRSVFDQVERGSLDFEQGAKALEGMADQAKRLGYELRNADPKSPGLIDSLLRGGMGNLRRDLARRITGSLDSNRLDRSFIQPRKGRDNSRELENLEEFGRDAASRIEAITGRFADQPKIVEQARKALADLDDLIDDIERKDARARKIGGAGIEGAAGLIGNAREAQAAVRRGLVRQLGEGFERAPTVLEKAAEALKALDEVAADLESRKPPQFEALLADIEGARRTIQEGLARPLDDILKKQERELKIGALLAQGREREADFLRDKQALIDQLGLADEQALERYLRTIGYQDDINDVIRDRINLLRDQARQEDILREKQAMYLNALEDIRSNIQQTIQGFSTRGLKSIGDFVGRLGDTYGRLLSEHLTERIFGDVYREMEDFIRGDTPLDRAQERMVTAVDGSSSSIADLGTAAAEGAAAIRDAAREIVAESGASAAGKIAAGAGGDFKSAVGAASSFGSPTGLLPLIGAITGTFAQHLGRGSAGLDIDAKLGAAIKAPAGGRVVTVGFDRRSGNHLIVDHGGGIVSSYSHLLKQPAFRPNTIISAGQLIGQVGNSGNVRSRGGDGSHLHYRVKVHGQDVDPAKFKFPESAGAAAEALGIFADNTKIIAESLKAANAKIEAAAQEIGQAAGSETGEDIIVTAPRRGSAGGTPLTPESFFGKLASLIGRKSGLDEKAAAKLGDRVGGHVSTALQGAAMGQSFGGMIFGRKNNNTAAAIGGAIGATAGKAIGTYFGGPIGGEIGKALGSFLGSTAGNLLFPKAIKKASSTITVDSGGRLVVGAATGNSKKFKKATSEAADAAIVGIERIAEALGATIRPGVGSVSIGVRHGDYRVDTSGRGRTKKKSGAIDFNNDAEAAVRFATLDLIKDGILGGLRASTQRLLQGAKDLDLGLEKALRFESVFIELKRRVDPAGAALDEVNKKFTSLQKLFKEAGASAEELASLDQLYTMERADAIKGATEEMTSALRSLLDDLTVNNDALSLRDRLAQARAKYDPLAADVQAGKRVDYDAFAEAGRNVEQIIRQIEGSGAGYFSFLDELTGLTTKALTEQQKLIDAASKTTPLDVKAGGAAPTEPVVGAIDKMKGALVDVLNGHLGSSNHFLSGILKAVGGLAKTRYSDGFVLDKAGF